MYNEKTMDNSRMPAQSASSSVPSWRGVLASIDIGSNSILLLMGRIVNGDPSYVDNWRDIAGYAQLVADELQGIER